MCPATVEHPATAFQFNLLDRFLYTHLEGKLSAYGFVGTLRVLTDYWFPDRVLVSTPLSFQAEHNHIEQDIYDQFERTMRIWHRITLDIAMGQCHGIDNVLTHRSKGNLVRYCPACPEPGVNTSSVDCILPKSMR